MKNSIFPIILLLLPVLVLPGAYYYGRNFSYTPSDPHVLKQYMLRKIPLGSTLQKAVALMEQDNYSCTFAYDKDSEKTVLHCSKERHDSPVGYYSYYVGFEYQGGIVTKIKTAVNHTSL